jgi:TIGR03009 family protein
MTIARNQTLWLALLFGVACAESAAAQAQNVRVQPGVRRQTQPAARTAQAPAGQRPAVQIAPQPPAPPPGFALDPTQQQELDQLLDAWEQAGKAITRFEVQFRRLEYTDPAPNAPKEVPKPPVESLGSIKFQAPDKGMYVARDKSDVVTDQWITDGKTIFEFRTPDKLVVAHHLPPQLQGKGIVDGPLPFLFGTEAAKLKARYWLRIVPPLKDSPPDQLMLEARPKFREDAQNYVKAQVILSKKDLSMLGLQVFYPGGRLRKVHSFGAPKVNQTGPLAIFEKDFSKPAVPRGWKFLEDPAPGAQQPPVQPRDAARPANKTTAAPRVGTGARVKLK